MNNIIIRKSSLALCLVAVMAACTETSLPTGDTDTGNLPITIGQLGIESNTATRLSLGSDSWENGDCIRVTAGARAGSSKQLLTATYKYASATASWQQMNPATEAAALDDDTYPLYLDDVDRTAPIEIETYGGRTRWSVSTDYNDQSEPSATGPYPDGDGPGWRYRLQDYLLARTATLTLVGSGADRRAQLSAGFRHQRVRMEVRIADGQTDKLPDDATLTLTGTTPVKAWRSGKAAAQGTTPATTTFLAMLKAEDVPGFRRNGTDTDADGNPQGYVSAGSKLGEMTYTSGGKQKTLKITYSVKTGSAGGNTLIGAGVHIVVNATFADLTPPPPTPPTIPSFTIDATATLQPWKDTEAGETGTTEKTGTD